MNDYPDSPSSIISTTDGGALTVGWCYEYFPYVVKLDEQGYIQWQKVLVDVNGFAMAAAQTHDGGYVVGGDGGFDGGTGEDFWLLKLNSAGEIQWQKAYGGNSSDEMFGLAVTKEGEIIFAGSSSSFGNGTSDIWVAGTDSDGDLKWQKLIDGGAFDWGGTISFSDIGSFMVGGMTDNILGATRMLLAKIDGQGQMGTPCGYLTDTQLEAREIFLTAYDNVAYVEESQATVQVPEVTIQPHGAQTFPLCEGDGRILHLPAAANTPGAFGTKWKTEAMLVNPSQAPLEYTLYYTPAGGDGVREFIPKTGALQARQAIQIPDLLKDGLGVENQAGSVRVISDGPLKVFTRTFNDPAGTGTYGQGIPLFERSAAIPLGEKKNLIGIRSDEGFRTNIGFQEVLSLPTTVKVRFYDPDGTLLAVGETAVPPYSWVQYPVSAWGLGTVESARAEVEVLTGGAILAYSSVADNRTGDPVFIPAEPEGVGEGSAHQAIPIIARTEGAYDTHWRTDLWLFNPTPAPQTVEFAFYTAYASYTASLTLDTGTFQRIADPIGTLFPQITGDAFGSLHINSAAGLVVWSRIYHDEAGLGTYGQSVPGVDESGLLSGAIPAILLPAKNTMEYRTNIGFTDFAGAGAEVRVRAYDLQGNLLGETPFAVPPYLNIQTGLFDALGVAVVVEGAWVEVELLSGGPVMPYLSVVDNRTGDAVFIPALKG